MLKELKIRNLALISDLTLEFKEGFNVLLGETGAGKSIILDAIDFALGAKADKNLISHGMELMKVEACFEDYNQSVSTVLKEMGFEDEGLLIISRSLGIDGKSDIKLNGNTLTLSMLKAVTMYLADSYSQHENLMLLKEKNQLEILDSLTDGLDNLKQELKSLLAERRFIGEKFSMLGGDDQNRNRELEFLKYQIDEIRDLNPTNEEENTLMERFKILSSSEKITNALEEAYFCLNQNNSALSQIKTAQKDLNTVSEYSESFEQLASRLESCYYEVEDICMTLRNEMSHVKYDQHEMDQVDSKLDKYKDLKRKYGSSVELVLKTLEDLESKYQMIANADEQLAKLNVELEKLNKKINDACQKISLQRKKTATEFENRMCQQFLDLGMKNGRFKVEFVQTEPNLNGYDNVRFMFSANLGEELKPLSKIISGGEMSRFMLAYKNLNVKEKSTVIFDEIDSGMAGEIGSQVAKKIANISISNQVICISHLPQVCAMADNFFFVYKTSENQKTQSHVEVLNEEQKVEKIAKLSGGEGITSEALAHAKSLLVWACDYKNSTKSKQSK